MIIHRWIKSRKPSIVWVASVPLIYPNNVLVWSIIQLERIPQISSVSKSTSHFPAISTMAWGSSQTHQVIRWFYYRTIYTEESSFLMLLFQVSSSSIHQPSLRQLLVGLPHPSPAVTTASSLYSYSFAELRLIALISYTFQIVFLL